MGAQAMWDPTKHPHGTHGHWASSSGGARKVVKEKGRVRAADRYDSKRNLAGHNMASAQTAIHSSLASGRKKSVTKFKRALIVGSSGRMTEVSAAYSYRAGKHGPVTPHPRGGTYRPLLQKSGWEMVGHRPIPQKTARQKMSGGGRHRAKG